MLTHRFSRACLAVVCGIAFTIIVIGCFWNKTNERPEGCLDNAAQHADGFLDRVQIYTNIAIPPEKACQLGVTVNGLWNGWGMKSPVASMHPSLYLWRFKNNRNYVEAIHRAGMLHGSTLSNVYAHKSMLKERPELKEAIDRTVSGETFTMDGGWYLGKQPFMCQNSPAWEQALVERAQRAIDAGTDAIVFDEPFGDTFFHSLPNPIFPGFSPHDLTELTEDIRRNFTPQEILEQFGITGLSPETLRERFTHMKLEELLGAPEGMSDATSPDVRLWWHFRQMQQRKNFGTRQRLVRAIRRYSEETQGVALPIGANLAGLESYSFLGQQMPVLYLAELFDFLAFEMAYRPTIKQREGLEGKEAFDLSIKGKWEPWHSLGKALVGPHRSLLYPSQELVDAWMEKEHKIDYLCHLFIEAYAAGSGFIIPFADFSSQDEHRLGQFTQFVRQHRDLFEGLQEVAPVGLLYSHGSESSPQHWSYLGTAQALFESGLPYSTLFSTSASAWKAELPRQRLQQFKLLLVPLAKGLNEAQWETLARYAGEDGGTLVLFETDHNLPVPLTVGHHTYGSGTCIVLPSAANGDTLGERYFSYYDNAIRSQIATTVTSELSPGSPLVLEPLQRRWAALPYAQPDRQRAVIHVINYDYDDEQDRFRPQSNITIQFQPSAFGLSAEKAHWSCAAYSPERESAKELPCRQQGGSIHINLPELGMHEALVVSSR